VGVRVRARARVRVRIGVRVRVRVRVRAAPPGLLGLRYALGAQSVTAAEPP
jgi:hypothetical protein